MGATPDPLSPPPPRGVDSPPGQGTAAGAQAAKRAKAEKIGRYAAMFIMPLLMVGMMITGYLAAMHSPTPHDMPMVIAGAPADTAPFVKALETADPDAVDLTVVRDADAARRMVFERTATGAVYLHGSNATLYTAGGAGASQASVVTGLVAPQAIAQGLTLDTEDVAPLPDSDSSGLGAMFMTTALVMAGYLPFSMLVSNSPELLRFRRAVPLLAGWSALMAGLVWAVTGPILGVVESGHAPAVLGISWLGVFAIGSVQLFFTRIFGSMAVLVGLFFLMVLGIPSSNMSLSLHTMPSLYPYLHSFLPTAAIGESMRSALHFGGEGAGRHLLVLALGAAVGLGLTLLVDAKKRNKVPHPEPIVINMPSLHGGPRPKGRFWRYVSIFVFPFAMVALMLSAMLGAMHEPTPRDMPVAVVGATTQQAQQGIAGLEKNMEGLFDLRAVDTAEEARGLVANRDVVGAFVLPTAQAPQATLVTSQAAGSSASQVVTQVFSQVAAGQHLELAVDDIAPLPASDSSGVVSMYLAMGWMLSGFMIIVVGANAAPASRPLRKLLPITAIYSAFMSAVVWLIAGPITGAIDGHFWQLFGTGMLAIFSVAMFAAVFERLIGMLAIIPVIGILMFLGVPASNGALSIYMEPEMFRVLHDFLPMPAAVESIGSILYFGGDVVGTHLLTFGIWGAGSLAAVFIIDRFKPVRTTTEYVTEPPAAPPVTTGPDDEHARELLGV